MPRPQNAVAWFGYHMLKKLEQNSHKRGWEEMELDYALLRLEEEVNELQEEVFDHKTFKGDRAGAIVDEAADIANFAMFIAWKFREEKDG